MTDDRSLERAARSWLEAGPTRAPDRAVDAALHRIETTSQERDLGIPWRTPTMNPLVRLAGAAIVAVLAAGIVFFALRPASSVGPPPPSTPRAIAPTAVIDLTGSVSGTIPLTTNGTDLWVGVDGGIIRIDGRTNATQRMAVATEHNDNGSIAITAEGLWIADFNGNRIQRLNPATGAVELTTAAQQANFLYVVDGELWVGSGQTRGVAHVDKATGALAPSYIGDSSFAAFGLGDIWVGYWDGIEGEHQQSKVIKRLDPATGATRGTIDVPAGTGCAVGGTFPDNVWATCPADYGTCPANRTAVRIDPATNRVAATAKVCGAPVGPVVVIDGKPWFLIGRKEGPDDAHTLVSVDPATGRILAQLDLGKCDPDVVVLTEAAVWLSDEQLHRVARYDLALFRP